MLISIVVPVYNVESYIEECIQSIQQQSYDKWELILVNDGSTDSSGQICGKYQNADSRITYIETENQGVSCARNTGMEYATGEWLMFVDADDWIENCTLEVIISNMQEEVDLYLFALKEVQSNKVVECLSVDKKKVLNQEDFLCYQRWIYNQYLYEGNYCISSCSCKLYRTQVLQNYGIKFPEGIPIGEDKIFNLNMFSHINQGIYIDEALYSYRIHCNSTMRRYRDDAVERIEKMLTQMERYMSEHGLEGRFRDDYNVRLAMSMMYYIVLDFCHSDNSKDYRTRRDSFNKVLKEERYKEAIEIVRVSTFPFKQRVLFMVLKTRCFWLVNFLCKLVNK